MLEERPLDVQRKLKNLLKVKRFLEIWKEAIEETGKSVAQTLRLQRGNTHDRRD